MHIYIIYMAWYVLQTEHIFYFTHFLISLVKRISTKTSKQDSAGLSLVSEILLGRRDPGTPVQVN